MRGAGIGNRICSVRRDDVDVKIYQPLSGDAGVIPAHAMSGVTDRAREAFLDVLGVFRKTCIGGDLIQVVTLAAKCVGTVHAEIGAGKQIRDAQPRTGSLAELVAALQNVRPLRSMRTIRPAAAKLAIVVAVVAIGAENLSSHKPPLRDAVQIQHVVSQTGLRQRAAANVRHRMAGSRGQTELRDQIQGVTRGNSPYGKIAEGGGVDGLARAAAVAPEAIFILIERRVLYRNPIGRADSLDSVL